MNGLILDQGLPLSLASLLRQRGLNATHVGEIDMSAASDEAIVAYARAKGLIIVTLDADFHALLAVSGALAPSVIRVRVQGLKARDACSFIQTVVDQVRNDLEAGALVSVNSRMIRVKRLPIHR